MADVILNATQILRGLLEKYASNIVTYTRGADSVDVPATFGQKVLKTHDSFGAVRIEWTDLDFIIAAVNLAKMPNFIEPKGGDVILVSQSDNKIQRYEVFPFGFEPPWRWSDPYLINYRIHTKLMKISDGPP